MATSRLHFKGDKKSKKRKRKHNEDNDNDDELNSTNDDGWVLPAAPTHIRGPTFILHKQSNTLLAFSSTAGKLVLTTAPDGVATPTDVAQVWVSSRLSGSSSLNIRTGAADGKFLSCDKYGVVTADRDARGPQEEWFPEMVEGGVALKNNYDKYLSLDTVAGGALALRGDSDEITPNEHFVVKVQAKFKREAIEEERKAKRIRGDSGLAYDDAEEILDERTGNLRYQAWGAAKSIVSTSDKKDLKKAKKDGRLAEALLDRRAKLKRCVTVSRISSLSSYFTVTGSVRCTLYHVH